MTTPFDAATEQAREDYAEARDAFRNEIKAGDLARFTKRLAAKAPALIIEATEDYIAHGAGVSKWAKIRYTGKPYLAVFDVRHFRTLFGFDALFLSDWAVEYVREKLRERFPDWSFEFSLAEGSIFRRINVRVRAR